MSVEKHEQQAPSVEPSVVQDDPAPTAPGTPPPDDVEKQPPKPPAMPTYPEGGLMGWLCVAGSFLVLFCTFGYANTFGVFQDYYQFRGYPNQTASDISWIGSVQLFFQFSLGAIAGPLYDKGYFYHLVITGSIIYVVCLYMVSLCTEFWQVVLAQALGIGIGVGILFLPGISILSQYFYKRRALAIGISTSGSSIGGVCLPIMLNNLIESHGFKKAVQYTATLILGCLVLACLLMHPRLPPNKGAQAPKPNPAKFFTEPAYSLLVAGLFCVSWGLFFPIFYLQVYAQVHGISQTLVFYTLAILNGASTFGRITPNIIADKFGSINLIAFMCMCAGALTFAMFGAGTPGGLIVVAILFGFFSGAYVSLLGPSLISMANSHLEIGARMGMGFLVTSLAALTGTPITGALLTRYGFYAPIVWSGVSIMVGGACFIASRTLQAKKKGTWKV